MHTTSAPHLIALRVRELRHARRAEFGVDDDPPLPGWTPGPERAVFIDGDEAWVTLDERSVSLPPDVSVGDCVLWVHRGRPDYAAIRRRLVGRWHPLNATSAHARFGQRQIIDATRCLAAVLAHLPGWGAWPRPRDCRLVLCAAGPALLVPVEPHEAPKKQKSPPPLEAVA